MLGSRLCLELTLGETGGQGALALLLQEGWNADGDAFARIGWLEPGVSECLSPGSLSPPAPHGCRPTEPLSQRVYVPLPSRGRGSYVTVERSGGSAEDGSSPGPLLVSLQGPASSRSVMEEDEAAEPGCTGRGNLSPVF